MRRFWTDATVADRDGAWTVLLDGKPMRLPSGSTLRVQNRAVAEAVAAEWQSAGGSVGGQVKLASLSLTRLVATAIDRIAPDPGPTIEALAKYGETDLLCYRADHPPELSALQAARWQPLLDWAAWALDAPLAVTAGVVHIVQPATSLAALRAALSRESALALAALGLAVPAMGSLVLGLALAAGRLGPAEAHALASLDEQFQAEAWGRDAEAEARLASIAADVALAHRLLLLERDGGDQAAA